MFRKMQWPEVGSDVHRSGWPYALRSMAPYFSDDSEVVFDDFVERTFLYPGHEQMDYIHREPWVGVFHHPPDMPAWYAGSRLQDLLQSTRWNLSRTNLKLAICLAPPTAEWIGAQLSIPTLVLKLPTESNGQLWSVERFSANPMPRLIQVGSMLRNTFGIYQVEVPEHFTKTRLVQPADWVTENHRKCVELYGTNIGPIGTVQEISRVSDKEYDALLADNVVFLDLLTAAATTAIVECIARNTPVVVNNLPGPRHYLGDDYPLFYDELRDVGGLLTRDKVLAAHSYLRQLPKDWLSGQKFATDIVEGCNVAKII